MDGADVCDFLQPVINLLLGLFEAVDFHPCQTTGFDISHHAFHLAFGFGAVGATGRFNEAPILGQKLISPRKYGPAVFISSLYQTAGVVDTTATGTPWK